MSRLCKWHCMKQLKLINIMDSSRVRPFEDRLRHQNAPCEEKFDFVVPRIKTKFSSERDRVKVFAASNVFPCPIFCESVELPISCFISKRFLRCFCKTCNKTRTSRVDFSGENRIRKVCQLFMTQINFLRTNVLNFLVADLGFEFHLVPPCNSIYYRDYIG